MKHVVNADFGDKKVTIETGWVAGQANGAVTVRLGDSIVLVTACVSDKPREGIDFFPLSVDYEERLYAAGRIPGSFFRREGRPTQEAILAGRLTDRPIRPLFPKGFRNEVQIISTVLSTDRENPPDVLSIIGASAALSISSIPFDGPISGCRVGYVDGELIAFPTYQTLDQSSLELVVASSKDAVVMIEAGAQEVDEGIVLKAIEFGRNTNAELIRAIDELVRLEAKEKIRFVAEEQIPDELLRKIESSVGGSLQSAIFSGKEKGERNNEVGDLRRKTVDEFGDLAEEGVLANAFDQLVNQVFRNGILKDGLRADGRGKTEIRPISCEVGVLPRTHGTGLFTRGQTQILSVATLGSLGEEQRLDSLSPKETKRFMHHYNFPPFSVGEVKRTGSPGRREIGHGALAERALEPVIPDKDTFPYAIRLVSEALSSNGSTSMGSVCGSTLALMDAGVPIMAPVAGIAMGLILDGSDAYAILTDIQGLEDHLGDMDFKVAGTTKGITALQMDIKVKGITEEIMEQALHQAKDARMFLIDKMLQAIPESRADLSPYAPRIVKISIPVEKIGAVIGPGGKTIRSIIEETKSTIDVQDDGTVLIGSPDEQALKQAQLRIEGLTKEIEVGSVYDGKVVRIVSFGAFVEILPGKDGLVRTPDLSDQPVGTVEEVVQVGDQVSVMVIEVDRAGRINLSRRAVLEGITPDEAIAQSANSRGGPSGFSGYGSGRGGPRPGSQGRGTRGDNRQGFPPRRS